MTGVVIATGRNTFFGRTAKLVAGAGAVSHAQKAMFADRQLPDRRRRRARARSWSGSSVYRDIVVADDWG